MSQPWTIVCDAAELAVECARQASELELAVEPEVSARPAKEAAEGLAAGGRLAVAVAKPPDPATLVTLSGVAGAAGLPMGLIGPDPRNRELAHLARDLGVPTVTEVRPLMAAIALLDAGAERPWSARARGLGSLDRARLGPALVPGTSAPAGRWEPAEVGRIGWAAGQDRPRALGEARDVAEALDALREAEGATRPPMPAVEGVDPQAVLDVIFGPRRELSDPASKAALAPYDLPMPEEELCTSASRAAAEASRIGFPVRIALASPDLRLGDHPDLAVDGVDNAARVRDMFRQLMALGQSRLPDARLLGVTVSATTPAHVLLRVRVTPMPEDRALCEIGFADAHGLASDDRTHTILPSPPARLEQALARLHGSSLLLEGTATERRRTVTALGDVLLRLAAFVHEWREQIESVTLDPLALLLAGGIEAREVHVVVGDAFERSLAAR